MRRFYLSFLSLILSVFFFGAMAQYTVNGNAVPTSAEPNATCFQLTSTSGFHQAGTVWNNSLIDLTQNFEFNTKLYFGVSDAGADGIAFVLQTAGTNALGISGGGLGYYQIPGPSFIVEFDTWQNVEPWFTTGDPLDDHIGFLQNADVFHNGINSLQAPQAFPSNIEDDQWHDAKFTWNATTKTLTVEFLSNTYSYNGDIVNTIFGGNPMVYWGFTAGTGSFVPTEHKVCIITQPPPPGDCGQLRTQTPGGWGAEPNGKNPGTYLHANFAAAFPGGLQVGCYPNNYYINLTTAQAITDLLPTGGKALALTQNQTNPLSIKNVLVGHLVALTLSTTFDVNDPDFGQAGITLGQMEIGSGTFAGWTVADFLTEANKVLGGCSIAYTPTQVLETATSINENYVDGKTDNGFVECPTSERTIVSRIRQEETVKLQNIRVYPNPSKGQFELQFGNNIGGSAQVIVVNAMGKIVQKITTPLTGAGQTLRLDLGKQAPGIYLVRIATDGGIETQKLIIQK